MSDNSQELFSGLIEMKTDMRITAIEALGSKWIKEFRNVE
jgi:hypothetical protein